MIRNYFKVAFCYLCSHKGSTTIHILGLAAGIVRALIARPKLLLANENTGNLNPALDEGIMQLFQKPNKEERVPLIQVTHSEKNASYGERIINLLDGRIQPMAQSMNRI